MLEVAEEHGIPTEVRDLWPMELYTADAMFATGSGAGIVPIDRVDGNELADGRQRGAHGGLRGLLGAHARPARTRCRCGSASRS